MTARRGGVSQDFMAPFGSLSPVTVALINSCFRIRASVPSASTFRQVMCSMPDRATTVARVMEATVLEATVLVCSVAAHQSRRMELRFVSPSLPRYTVTDPSCSPTTPS